MFLQKMRRDNYLSQISRTQRNFRNKREKKTIKIPLDPKEAEDNPVYRALKKQKDTETILNYIVDHGEVKRQKKISSKYTRSKTQIFDVRFGKNIEQIDGRAKSLKTILQFQQKGFGIVSDSRKFYHDLQQSKKRIKILDKFNKKIGKYCSYLPDNPEQTRNESNIANQQLRRLCNHNFFPSDNVHKRTSSLVQYREPKIPLKKYKILKSRFLTSKPTVDVSADTQPLQRVHTVHF